ncbi:MAG: hypothetical protein LKF31_11605 [Muribaculaceae bacterium]|jgi:hypothetical protein|nr:hypothetical protein [Muribaculaceae bacterium]
MKKNILFSVMCLLMITLLASCGKENKIPGKYKTHFTQKTEASGTSPEMNLEMDGIVTYAKDKTVQIDFKITGKVIISQEEYSNTLLLDMNVGMKGTWTVDGDRLKQTIDVNSMTGDINSVKAENEDEMAQTIVDAVMQSKGEMLEGIKKELAKTSNLESEIVKITDTEIVLKDNGGTTTLTRIE